MRWMIVALALCAGVVATPARAQSVYKCVASGKPVSFQSEPCGPGETTAAVREFAHEPASPPMATPALRQPAVRASRQRVSRAAHRETATFRDACADARAQRDEWERRVGLKRTYDQLRHWNDTVDRACR